MFVDKWQPHSFQSFNAKIETDGIQVSHRPSSIKQPGRMEETKHSGSTLGISWLVGGLEHEFYFSIYWEYLGIMIPTDALHHFSEG
jgi:hypothetical protein